jgi:SAM-dependent methyltransferase
MTEDFPTKNALWACPKCKGRLGSNANALQCDACDRTYACVSGIPDFLSQASLGPAAVRIAKTMDFVAPIYESRPFVSMLLRLSGVSGPSGFIDKIASFHAGSLKEVTGFVLDVACGPATYARRMVSPYREVYGIDISMGVLLQGMAYLARDGVKGIRLARARVEELPFVNAVFDGAVCSGSLHLFPDTVLALREIARTMKPGAPLSVQTFVSGPTVVNRFLQTRSWLHTFEPTKLQKSLTETGFEAFQPEVDGIVLTFSARKAIPRT